MGHPFIRGEVGRMSWSFEPDLSVHQASWCVLRQCSEICGVNHGFMPIVIEAVALDDYVSWVSAKLEDLADEE